MKTLSHLSVAVFAAAITLSSCKKSSTPTPAPVDVATSMKLSSNGTVLNYNECQQFSVTANGLVQTEFVAKNAVNNQLGDDGFEVDIIHDPATLKAGQTYLAGSSFAQKETASLTYYPNDTDMFSTPIGDPKAATVTITEVTSTTISGTFSGTLSAFNNVSPTQPGYTITNGSFTAKKLVTQ